MVSGFKEIFEYEDFEIRFTVPIITPTMLICGDSATGKTYVLNRLQLAKKNIFKSTPSIYCNYKFSDIYIILDENEITEVYKKVNTLIFIDRFDILATRNLVNFINESNNSFVLMYRDSVAGLKVTRNSYIELYNKQVNDKWHFEAR